MRSVTLKLKSMLNGKSKKGRAFKNEHLDQSEWMSAEIPKKWFYGHSVPKVEEFSERKKLNNKAILLLENITSQLPQ